MAVQPLLSGVSHGAEDSSGCITPTVSGSPKCAGLKWLQNCCCTQSGNTVPARALVGGTEACKIAQRSSKGCRHIKKHNPYIVRIATFCCKWRTIS